MTGRCESPVPIAVGRMGWRPCLLPKRHAGPHDAEPAGGVVDARGADAVIVFRLEPGGLAVEILARGQVDPVALADALRGAADSLSMYGEPGGVAAPC